MGTPRTRYDRLLAIGLALLHMAWSSVACAQPVDLTQREFTSTLAQIEKADGWYDETNYGAAAAGVRSKKYFVPDGIDMGNYLLFLEVGAGTTYDDNIYATKHGATGDFRTVGTASLAAISRLPRHLFNVYLDGRYVNYADSPEADYLEGSAAADWRLDIDHGHALGGRISSSYEREDRLAPEAPLEAREAVPVLDTEAEVAFTRDQGRLGATFGLDFADHDYADVEAFDGSRIDQDFRDMTSYGAYLGLNYRFSPGYKLLASVRAGRELYHDADADLRDATLYEGKLGLAFELSPLWRANVSVGYGLADYDADNRDRTGAFIYDGQLVWLASPLMTMTLTAGQSIDEASFGNEGALIETHAKIEAEYEAMRNLMLTASLGYEQADIANSDRTDDVYTARIGAEYTINKNVLFTLGYEHQERLSSDADYEMQVNRYMAGLKIRF